MWVWRDDSWALYYSCGDRDVPLNGGFGAGGPDWTTIAMVAPLAAFLAAFTKELGSAAGKASSDVITKAARQLKEYVRQHRETGHNKVSIHDGDDHILVVPDVDGLPTEAWEQLVSLDFPDGKGRLWWDAKANKWRLLRK